MKHPFTIDVGNGIVFGPYGPGKCPHAWHGSECQHWHHHRGCCKTEHNGVTVRWTPSP